MRMLLGFLLVLTMACAGKAPLTVPPVTPPRGFVDADPAIVADRNNPKPPAAIPVYPAQTARVRVVTATGVPEVITIPSGEPHFITFCDPTKSWSSARWFLIRINAVDQPNTGPVTVVSQDCYKTPSAYTFAPGTHQLDVLLDNHCEAGATEPLCLDSNQQPPTSTVDTYGQPTTVQAQASAGQLLAGSPPSISNGQVIR